MKKTFWQEPRMAFFFLLPAFIGVLAFNYYPIIQTLIYSFFDLHRTTDWWVRPFVGVRNYAAVFGSTAFWEAMKFTLYFTAMTVIFQLIFGLLMAMATFQVNRFWGGLLRAVIIIPWAIPPIISAMIWKLLLHSDVGLFGFILKGLGVVEQTPQFLTNPILAMNSVVFADIWKNSSIVAIMLMGGLAAIPSDIYDAAKVDGARPFLRFRDITFPMLLPTFLIVLLFRLMDAIRTFDIIYGLTGGGPGSTTETLSTFAYKYYFTYTRFGVGSAYAMTIFFMILAVVLIYIGQIKHNLRFKG